MADAQCRRCLYTTAHPLGLTIDSEGVCSGCRIHEEKDRLDWDHRFERLRSLVEPYRCRSGDTYDCVVPVSGANDSYFIVHVVKKRLGLNPLLVTYNKYFNTPLGIRNLANLRIRMDCDILIQNVNPVSVRKVTRATLRQFGSMYWPCLAGQTVFPVQTAVRYGIPLIIWGAHQGLEQVGMFSHEHEVEMTRRYRKDHDLMGREADDLLSSFDTLTEGDIWQYRYPDDHALHRVGVRGIYLGNYLRWDPKAQHEEMIRRYDYASAEMERTFDTYDHVDCFSYMGIHDALKWYKTGYGKATDHACREIRHGRLHRDAAQGLVARHQARPPGYIDLFCDWLGVDRAGLQFALDRHRNPDFWTEEAPGSWRPRRGADSDSPDAASPGFTATDTLERSVGRSYVIFGTGWPT